MQHFSSERQSAFNFILIQEELLV